MQVQGCPRPPLTRVSQDIGISHQDLPGKRPVMRHTNPDMRLTNEVLKLHMPGRPRNQACSLNSKKNPLRDCRRARHMSARDSRRALQAAEASYLGIYTPAWITGAAKFGDLRGLPCL